MSSPSGYDDFYQSLSLHLPIHVERPDAGAPTPASMLLDFTAYIDAPPNATTAWSKTRDGHSISVTFWPAQPPRVSYFSVFCPDLKPGDFTMEPFIMAAEDDLVLLCVGTRYTFAKRDMFDYFVYQAGGCSMPSSLKLLKHPGPSRMFDRRNVGLLRCRAPKLDHGEPTLRSHGSKVDGFYIVAALSYYATMVPGHYDLYTYDSRTGEWATKTALLRREQELGQHFSHLHTKVIAVGGTAGTMGWVDLWRGILFCDVLRQDCHTVPLCYVTLPPPLKPDRKLQGDPRTARDIAVVQGRIKYIEIQTHVRPGSVVGCNYISDDWTAATWSRKAASAKSLEKGSWQPGGKVRASQISAKKKPVQFELLPKLFDDQGTPQPTLERLHTGLPALCLHQNNVVYLMAKVHFMNDTKAWVLAIDVKKKTLQGVAEFDAQRTIGMIFTFMCSSISEHLHMAPATHGHLKRPGVLMWQSYLKKQAGIMDGEQKRQDSEVGGTSVGVLDQDSMDLE